MILRPYASFRAMVESWLLLHRVAHAVAGSTFVALTIGLIIYSAVARTATGVGIAAVLAIGLVATMLFALGSWTLRVDGVSVVTSQFGRSRHIARSEIAAVRVVPRRWLRARRLEIRGFKGEILLTLPYRAIDRRSAAQLEHFVKAVSGRESRSM